MASMIAAPTRATAKLSARSRISRSRSARRPGGKTLRIRQILDPDRRVENHRGGDHGARQWPATRFIDASNDSCATASPPTGAAVHAAATSSTASDAFMNASLRKARCIRSNSSRTRPLPIGMIEPFEHQGTEPPGRRIVLKQLRHQPPAGEEVRQSHMIDVQHRPPHHPSKAHGPIGDHHRALEQHCFERRGPGREQDHVARRHRIARLPQEQIAPDVGGMLVQCPREESVRRAVDQGRHEPHVGPSPVHPARGARKGLREAPQLAHSTAGEKRHGPGPAVEGPAAPGPRPGWYASRSRRRADAPRTAPGWTVPRRAGARTETARASCPPPARSSRAGSVAMPRPTG